MAYALKKQVIDLKYEIMKDQLTLENMHSNFEAEKANLKPNLKSQIEVKMNILKLQIHLKVLQIQDIDEYLKKEYPDQK
jgi:hypothetical protein